MFPAASLLAFSLLATVYGQQVGTLTAEVHPRLTVQQCTSANNCQTQQHTVVLDSNWRWLHATGSSTNCYTGNTWDASLCPDPVTCASNCALDGADYAGTYGITTNGNALTLKFVTQGPYSKNIGSRVYLMAQDDANYELFNLKNQEFTFDVDMSNLPCGLNGALYFVEMDADGGKSRFPANKAGAKYGTGYCDTQCPQDIKFINGEANILGWEGSPSDPNAGSGQFGTCCNEMDVWEANMNGAAVTPHVCSIRRLYVQNGKVIANSKTNIPGLGTFDSITDAFCNAQKQVFGDTNTFEQLGGLAQMGNSFQQGMALVMSIWDDHAANMLWLDSDYPTDVPATNPGVARGPCPANSGIPATIETSEASASVTFSNIKFGPIGSTY
ncbi:glycoside hydrolase family 7 protein [Trametes sanguinea]|nr:glycoside hydrolase family 7 protein [Trametes sanguinea]